MKASPFLFLSVIAISCLASAASSLPALKADRWVNSAPLTTQTLQGKVVLIDFWEYLHIPGVFKPARITVLSQSPFH